MALVGAAIAAALVGSYATPLYLYYWSSDDYEYAPKVKLGKKGKEGVESVDDEKDRGPVTNNSWFAWKDLFEDPDPFRIAQSAMSVGSARTADPNNFVKKTESASPKPLSNLTRFNPTGTDDIMKESTPLANLTIKAGPTSPALSSDVQANCEL